MQLNNTASRWALEQRTSRVLLLFLLSLATCQPLIGLPVTEFNPTLWQTEEGLPNNNVLSIAQTQDGYLWVGTREGLARFDGIKFTPLMVTRGSPQPTINALCAWTTVRCGSALNSMVCIVIEETHLCIMKRRL